MENKEKAELRCKVCGVKLVTDEEKELKWCTKHLDEFDKLCGR